MSDDDYDDGRFGSTTRSSFAGGGFPSKRKPDPEPVVFEARIEVETAKAYLIEPTVFTVNSENGMIWMPKSQIVRQADSNTGRVCQFTVKAWWWNKQIEEGTIDA